MSFSSKSDNYSSYPIHRYLETPLSNFEVAVRNKKLNLLIPLYQKSFEKGLENLRHPKGGQSNNLNKLTKTRGFIESNELVTNQIIKADEANYLPLAHDSFDTGSLAALQKLTTGLEEKGISVSYFELPTYLLNDYFNAQFIKDYEKALLQLSENNELIRINKNLFGTHNYRNIDHMNRTGAQIASNELARLITNNKR